MKRRLCLAAGALSVLTSASGLAASFPCEKATSKVEVLICKESEISTLDEHLAQYYAGATAGLAEGAGCLKDNQRSWLRTVRNACGDAACLKQVYLRRLSELHALQPGATSIRYFELPKAPSLAWIVPPEKDTVAAPARSNLRELVVKGKLVNDVVQGDGFVVQAGDGRKHVLLPSMFVDGANLDRLTSLAKDPAAQFEVRGYGETDSRGIPHFAASRCSFIYRIAQ
jgi:uncharacterized protein